MRLKACFLYLVCYLLEYHNNVLNICFLYVDPDTEGDDPVGRGKTMGEGPKRLSRVRALRGKLPVVIPKGQTRPESALIASKFARECNNALRTGVPVRSHWNKYKGDNGLLDNYYSEVAVST